MTKPEAPRRSSARQGLLRDHPPKRWRADIRASQKGRRWISGFGKSGRPQLL